MTYVEHYFENLLIHGKDINGEPNKKALMHYEQEAVEICANSILYSWFNGREDFLRKSGNEDLIGKAGD